MLWWVLAELIPGEDELIFAESSQILVCHHPALNEARCEFLQHLEEAQTEIQVITNEPFPMFMVRH